MVNPSYLGYLTNPYLDDPYLGDTGLYAWGMEVNRQIVNRENAQGMEAQRQIVNQLNASGAEVGRVINATEPFGSEVDRLSSNSIDIGSEVNRQIVNRLYSLGMEANRVITGSHEIGSEVERFIKDRPSPRGMEVQRQVVNRTKPFVMEIRRDKTIAHWFTESLGYLEEPYLSDPYLSPGIIAQMDMEVLRRLSKTDATGMEVNRVIRASKALGSEVLLRINSSKKMGMEIDRLQASSLGMQTRLVLYNTNRLRILCDFPSRGVSGTNWTASSTAAGDFSANNLNTDIVEQVWRSVNSVTSVVLTCDTEVVQGVAIDTLALLNHNLTTSATITVEGSDNISFSPVEQSFAVVPTRQNAYYIAPTFPTIQSRYWRIIIADPTNPDGRIQIGTLLFGNATIFQGECFTDNVTRRRRHFSDKVPTEGFTNVSNDRALKRAISLEFRWLRYQQGNFRALEEIFEEDRTSLKCLWIPDPQDPGRFGAFAKLVQLPDELHRNLGAEASDTVDLNIEVDESL
jgi:hypothetical protein